MNNLHSDFTDKREEQYGFHHSVFTILFIFCWICYGNGPLQAQEVRFVQSLASPLLINPAMTGDLPGRFRVSLINRQQWSPALGAPIESYAFGGDAKFKINGEKDRFGLGILFFSDRFSTFQTHVNHISLSTSYHKSLSANNNSILQAGLQFGVGQRGVNYENFTFEDQFDGINKYNHATQEILPPNSLANPELAFGLQYKTRLRADRLFYIGVSGYHLIKSQVAYYSKIINDNVPFSKENYLFRRFHLYTGMHIERQSIRYSPSFKASTQGPVSELSIGGTIRRQFYDSKISAIHLGTWLLGGNNDDGWGMKSLAAMIGTEFNGLIIGFSYDQLFHDYFKGVGGMVAFELSLTYIGNYENDFTYCPTF